MIARLQRIPRQGLVAAAAVLAAAVVLALFLALRPSAPSDVALEPAASPATTQSGGPTLPPPSASAGPSGSGPSGSASPSGSPDAASPSPSPVAAPSLSEVTAAPTPKATEGATFPPSWNGKLVPASPTPSPRAQMWRLEGVVIDRAGNAVKDVCIAIGPHGCQPTSPRTDANGVYWADLPQADVTWDLHYFHDGFQVADRSIHPFGNTRLDVLLLPS